MSIKSWPKNEQPREKLLHHGPEILSDAELLAIFLRTGIRGKSAIELARELISKFGNLARLLNANKNEFCKVPGLGPAKYAALQAIVEMTKRSHWANLTDSRQLSSPNEARDFLVTEYQHCPHEVFSCLFLDNKHRIISFKKLFRGTIDSAAVYPREVVLQALAENAAAVIFSHNHPSGDPQPSQADISMTEKLQNALQLVEIRVLDHLIVSRKKCFSLAEHGLI